MQQTQNMLRYAGLATQWMVMLLIAVWAGHKLDELVHWKAGFIILFPIVSLAFSLWQIVKEFSKPKK